MEENNYYIYAHFRLDNSTIFYIGKGKDNRAYVKSGRNNYWSNIVEKSGYKVKILYYNLSEKEAFDREMYLIRALKKNNQCEANIVLGGEGVSGLQHSTQSKAKIAQSMVGKFKGKKHSLKSRINMSRGSLGQSSSRGVKHTRKSRENMSIGHGGKPFNVYTSICRQKPSPRTKRSGTYNKGSLVATFINQKEAADTLNVNQSDISLCLRGRLRQAKGFIFEYTEEL